MPQEVRNPQVGMLAVVRKRWGIIRQVREFDGTEGRLHLVGIDYKDNHRPQSEQLLWELEPARLVQESAGLPPFSSPSML